jgi:hypothetical protein
MAALKQARETNDWNLAKSAFAETLGLDERTVEQMLSPYGKPW